MAVRLNTDDAGFEKGFVTLLQSKREDDADVSAAVSAIISEVIARGDEAVLEYTHRFDGIKANAMDDLCLDGDAMAEAYHAIDDDLRAALTLAADRIRCFHERQLPQDISFTDDKGVDLGLRHTPVDAAGLYVPGGKAAYPSSVLMNTIPALVAGVPRRVIVVPAPDGEVPAIVLAAAHIAGISEVWRIGGAQAIAALAYGTQSISPVDKIVGPGNAYVAAAKRQVFGKVGIDSVAGPSEILVLADKKNNPDWVAMDLFAQAEHDDLAQSILLCTDAAFIDAVATSIAKLLPEMPRRQTIATSLANRGALIHVRDLDEACAIANRIAPEHLELSMENAEDWIGKIRHAGAIFVGHWSVEALGDYCAGPNHVLPTMRSARFSSPLGVYDFQKRTSLIQVSEAGAQTLGPIAATLADGEGLQAHAASARYRVKA